MRRIVATYLSYAFVVSLVAVLLAAGSLLVAALHIACSLLGWKRCRLRRARLARASRAAPPPSACSNGIAAPTRHRWWRGCSLAPHSTGALSALTGAPYRRSTGAPLAPHRRPVGAASVPHRRRTGAPPALQRLGAPPVPHRRDTRVSPAPHRRSPATHRRPTGALPAPHRRPTVAIDSVRPSLGTARFQWRERTITLSIIDRGAFRLARAFSPRSARVSIWLGAGDA